MGTNLFFFQTEFSLWHTFFIFIYYPVLLFIIIECTLWGANNVTYQKKNCIVLYVRTLILIRYARLSDQTCRLTNRIFAYNEDNYSDVQN